MVAAALLEVRLGRQALQTGNPEILNCPGMFPVMPRRDFPEQLNNFLPGTQENVSNVFEQGVHVKIVTVTSKFSTISKHVIFVFQGITHTNTTDTNKDTYKAATLL